MPKHRHSDDEAQLTDAQLRRAVNRWSRESKGPIWMRQFDDLITEHPVIAVLILIGAEVVVSRWSEDLLLVFAASAWVFGVWHSFWLYRWAPKRQLLGSRLLYAGAVLTAWTVLTIWFVMPTG